MTQEIFERVKMLYETANADQKYVLESLFPELAESEDERIRKEIISALKWANHKGVYDKHIAWLEKQGNPDVNPSEFDLRLNKLLKQFESLPKEELVSSLGFYLNVVQNDGTYKDKEKQGEQSDSDVKDYNSIDPHFGKSVDKIKPKFHEGEWITNGDYTWKIVEVKPLDYILQSQDGNIVDDTISHVDEQFHSFTIKDARDGDVLALSYASQNYILIYKGLHEKDFDTMMSVFCSYYVEENTYDDETDCFHAMNRGEIITPATKEQRDILIKAMNDAGYTFDFEKKELKEMEQKPAWNEEDESNLNGIIDEVDANKNWAPDSDKITYDRFISWLKSLKDRVQSKSQWKPSDEQMDVLETAVSSLQSNTLKSLYQDLMREKNYE